MIDLESKDWQPFAAADPFNNGNWVEGKISHHNGDDYGALYIEKVNDEKAIQLIFCTPKLQYPFDRSGNWHFPKAKTIERWCKLDGTNCFAFRYTDNKGKQFLSYKTRLLPFMGNSRFGPFMDMWKEILKAKPILGKLPWQLEVNMSFEIFGARNTHLMKYEIPLDAALLFARKDGRVVPPSALGIDLSLCATFHGNVTQDYVWSYKQAQEKLDSELKQDEDGYWGQEGEVWYLLDETGTWNLFKCKSSQIEVIHWSSGAIGKNTLIATIQNAFENWDNPTIEQIQDLLLEEFTADRIERIHYLIPKCLDEVHSAYQFKQEVLEQYRSLGMSVLDQKREVMRALSDHFDRKQMTRVFSIIQSHETK